MTNKGSHKYAKSKTFLIGIPSIPWIVPIGIIFYNLKNKNIDDVEPCKIFPTKYYINKMRLVPKYLKKKSF